MSVKVGNYTYSIVNGKPVILYKDKHKPTKGRIIEDGKLLTINVSVLHFLLESFDHKLLFGHSLKSDVKNHTPETANIFHKYGYLFGRNYKKYGGNRIRKALESEHMVALGYPGEEIDDYLPKYGIYDLNEDD